MKFNITKIAAVFVLCVSINIQNTKAQEFDFTNILKAPQPDIERYLNNYVSPGLLSIANGMAGGWYNTAKPHKKLGLDLTFTANIANIPEGQRLFTFNATDYDALELTDPSVTRLPTLVGGGQDNTQFDGLLRLPATAQFTGQDGETYKYSEDLILDAPFGVDLEEFPIVGVPTPTLQLGIGLFKNTDLKIRFAQFSDTDTDFNLFGFGILHDIKQWIPGIKQLPIDVSIFFGTTKMRMETKINESISDFTGLGFGKFEVNASTFQVLVSKKLSIFTPYFGLGVNRVSSSFQILGDYQINNLKLASAPNGPSVSYSFKDPIDLKVSGGGGLRTTLGFRLKLAILTLHADYTIQEYNLFSAGIGLSIR